MTPASNYINSFLRKFIFELKTRFMRTLSKPASGCNLVPLYSSRASGFRLLSAQDATFPRAAVLSRPSPSHSIPALSVVPLLTRL